MLFPYDVAVPDMLDMLARNDLPLALINCPPPNYTGGARGFAAVVGSRFQQDFKRALRYAKALGAQHLHIMAGVPRGPRRGPVLLRICAGLRPKHHGKA